MLRVTAQGMDLIQTRFAAVFSSALDTVTEPSTFDPTTTHYPNDQAQR
jgi:hypothetical protein